MKHHTLLHLLIGYWYVDVVNDSSLSTTMAYSTSAREAFISGMPLPPDDEVHSKYIEPSHLW